MADAGLIVYNDSGSVQLDTSYKNLCLRQKGVVTTAANLPSGHGSYASFNLTGLTTPIIAVGGAVAAAPQTYYDAANSRHGFLISTSSAIGAQIPYYIFDVPVDLNSTYGFTVRDATGQLIFDALQPPLRVRGFYTNQPTGIGNLPAGKTYVVAHPVLGVRTYTIEVYTRLYATMPTSNGFGMYTIDYSGLPASPEQRLVRYPTLLAIDVTGY